MPAQEIGGGRLLLDLQFQDEEGIIGTYALPAEEGWALVEVGPTTCREALLKGLEKAGIGPEEVRHVGVTHIHLDHAGGCGALAKLLPRATFYVHEAGVPHLLDPSKLVESARRAWGPASDTLWGPIEPLPADRVRAVRGGERIPLARGASLEVLATPGHARHHVAFFDTRHATIFTGDGAGVLVPGATHVRPALPPPDLDVPLVLSSLARMIDRGPREVAFSHYGLFDRAPDRLRGAAQAVERWRDLALEVARRTPSVEAVARALEDEDRERARSEGEGALLSSKTEAISGLEMAAMGLLRYFTKAGLLPPSG